MNTSWFSNRLTSAKKQSVLWVPLATMVQTLVESNVNTYLERLSNRKSIFLMGTEDLTTKITELGKFFTVRSTNTASVPIILQQRMDEIHFKGTDRPITQTIYREFNGIGVTWEPLYAPADTKKYPYPSILITKGGLDTAVALYGEMFLTSRGKITFPINDLVTNWQEGDYDIYYDAPTQTEILDAALVKFNQIVKPLLPCHIVYEGYNLQVAVSLQESIDYVSGANIIETDSLIAHINDDKFGVSIIASESFKATQGEPISFPYRRYDTDKSDTNILDTLGSPNVYQEWIITAGKTHQSNWPIKSFNLDDGSLDQNIVDGLPEE